MIPKVLQELNANTHFDFIQRLIEKTEEFDRQLEQIKEFQIDQ